MTPVVSAILQISVMLLVAFGIGALMMHYRWKQKYQQLLDQLNSLQQDHDQLANDHRATITSFEKHKQENASALEDLRKSLELEKREKEGYTHLNAEFQRLNNQVAFFVSFKIKSKNRQTLTL